MVQLKLMIQTWRPSNTVASISQQSPSYNLMARHPSQHLSDEHAMDAVLSASEWLL